MAGWDGLGRLAESILIDYTNIPQRTKTNQEWFSDPIFNQPPPLPFLFSVNDWKFGILDSPGLAEAKVPVLFQCGNWKNAW